MEQTFDTSLNSYLTENTQDSRSNVLSTILGGGVASVVDIGASLYNSLPGTDEVDTEEILGRIGGDALRVYQENPDTIRTISLIGGALLPGAAAVKGMNALRNGSKAVNWFTSAGKKTDIARAAELFANGGKATSEYKKLLWGMRGKGVANNVVDAAAAELAILGTYGAHPYMEDYLKDPAKNFAIGVAFGGVVGGGIGAIIDNRLLKAETGKIAEGALSTIMGAIRPVAPGMPEATKLQSLHASIGNLGEIIKSRKDLGKNEFDDLTHAYAQKVQREYQKGQSEIFEAMIDPSMRNLPAEEKTALMNQVLNNTGFWGVEKIKSVTAKELLKNNKINQIMLDEPGLVKISKDAAGDEVRRRQIATFFPEINKFGTPDDIAQHGGVSALGLSERDLLKQVPDQLSSSPNFDYTLSLGAKSTPAVEADYAAWALKFGAMDDEAFEKYLGKTLISSSDIPQMQALSHRVSQSNVLRNTAKIRIASEEGKAAAVLEDVNIQRTLGGTPVKYQEAAEKLLTNQAVDSKYSIIRQWPGSEPAALLDAWIGGKTHGLMQAATSYFARGFAKSSMGKVGKMEALDFAKIYENPMSQALRADLLKNLADKDGKIYLYRGVNAPKIFGQAPLESMAISLDKAKQFSKGVHGKNLLYKIDVDDVVTAFVDIGPGSNNVELIVRASAREADAVLTNNGKLIFNKGVEKALKTESLPATEAMVGDLNDLLYQEKYKVLQDLINKGYPIDSIAKRTNIPVDSLNQFFASDRSFDSFERIKDISTFKTADDARNALKPSNRPVAVTGNLNKVSYTKNHANLNAKELSDIDSLFKSSILMNSTSEPVRELGAMFFDQWKPALDIARAQLGKVNNELAGNRFFTSADQFTRNMGDIGPVVSAVGRETTAIANRMASNVVGSLKEFMADISKDTAALTEFAVAHNLNASLRGYRVYRDRQLFQQVERFSEADGKNIQVLEPVLYNGQEFKVATDSVDALLTKAMSNSKELYDLADVSNKITGSAPLNNIGLWMPSFNPVDKFIAYVHNRATDSTQVLWGKTANELEDAIKSFGSELAQNPNLMIVKKSDQEWWSKLNGRLDPIHMQRADIGMQKTGSGASALPKISTDLLAELAGGYEHYINAQVRKVTDLSLSDLTDQLRQFSAINQSDYAGQSLSGIKSAVQQPKDSAKSVLNLLLGQPALGEYEGWKSINKSFETGVSMASSALGTAWRTATAPLTKGLFKNKQLTAEKMKEFDYDAFSAKLEEAGVVNPFALYDKATAIEKYGIANLQDAPDVSRRLITSTNAMAATVALRFAEIAHPLVNLMSMPILTSLSNGRYLPESFLGVQKATASVPTTQIMYEGIRAMNSPAFKSLNDKWEALGYFKPLVSEVSDVMRASRSFEKGAVAKLENLVDSKFVEIMSSPADYSETLSRKIAMNTGAQLAKRLYPELDANGITIFARDFMDKSLGNYSAAQRPAFFQGTLGMAMGLFQTYMLTLAQGIYRNVELKDWKTLSKAALAQSTIFGTSSLPGFDPISKAIAENFSDDNVDLTTGTYRALGDSVADFTLYGLPSNLTGAAFHTRGDIDPRFPNVLAGMDNVVAVNMAMQATTMISEVARSLMVENEDVGQSLLQALSLQTMSRPVARFAELGSGHSITRQGNTVQIPEEVWSMTGIIARVLSTRPMEEAKLREADHLNSYYASIDREKRQKVMANLKTMIRNGTVSESKVAEVAEDYMRHGGTPRGWRAAYKTALGRAETSGEEVFLDKLKDDSPFHFMINNLD